MTISADLLDYEFFLGGPGGGSVLGYLTDQVGPGTTVLDEIVPSVVVPYAPGHAGLLTLFSGLTLGPGSYFLTISGNAGFSLAGETGLPTTGLDTGVALLGFGLHCCSATYGPADVEPWTFSSFLFEVTGDPVSAVPEPSTLTVSLLGALVLIGRARFRRRF